eukprot:7224799-Pyramimonas_sp.AAC.1
MILPAFALAALISPLTPLSQQPSHPTLTSLAHILLTPLSQQPSQHPTLTSLAHILLTPLSGGSGADDRRPSRAQPP